MQRQMWHIGPRENNGRKENGGTRSEAAVSLATASCQLALALTAGPQRASLLGTRIPLPTCKETDLLFGRRATDSSWCCAQPGFFLGGRTWCPDYGWQVVGPLEILPHPEPWLRSGGKQGKQFYM